MVDLSSYDNSDYNPGAGKLKLILWYFVNLLFFKNAWFPFIGPKRIILRFFGAQIGKGLIIKPAVNIKYPWNLKIGQHVWIGEGVWIDNLGKVSIEDHACLSQGAMLLCGNHDYKKSSFDLIVQDIHIQEGAWVGAQAIICPGVILASHSVVTVKSVAVKSTTAYGIYQGNPAIKVKEREIESE